MRLLRDLSRPRTLTSPILPLIRCCGFLLPALLIATGCAGGLGNARLGHLPIQWTSKNQLYADAAQGKPAAIAEVQLELLSKDLQIAEAVLQRNNRNSYDATPNNLDTIARAGLLFDWPVDPTGNFLLLHNQVPTDGGSRAWIAWELTDNRTSQTQSLSYGNRWTFSLYTQDPSSPGSNPLLRTLQLNRGISYGNDPFRNNFMQMNAAPITVAPGDAEDEMRFHGFYSEGQFHALATDEAARLYCFGRYLETRLTTYLQVFGQYPADWSTLLKAFRLAPLTYVLHASDADALAAAATGQHAGLEGGFHTIEPATLQFVGRYHRHPPGLPDAPILLRHVVEYRTVTCRPVQVLEPALFPRAAQMRFEQMLLATLPAVWTLPPALSQEEVTP